MPAPQKNNAREEEEKISQYQSGTNENEMPSKDSDDRWLPKRLDIVLV